MIQQCYSWSYGSGVVNQIMSDFSSRALPIELDAFPLSELSIAKKRIDRTRLTSYYRWSIESYMLGNLLIRVFLWRNQASPVVSISCYSLHDAHLHIPGSDFYSPSFSCTKCLPFQLSTDKRVGKYFQWSLYLNMIRNPLLIVAD